jgi:archaeal type IV pilus assembly protein PilA
MKREHRRIYMIKRIGNKKGMSPVIATVILVAVTIVVAVGVAYWMGGIATSYTRFESIQINSAYAAKSGTNYVVTMQVQNSGSADATIDNVLINSVPFAGAVWGTSAGSLTSGKGDTVTITIPQTQFASGTSINIQLHSGAGKLYPQMVTLP